jgi:putative cell wall-binding protein
MTLTRSPDITGAIRRHFAVLAALAVVFALLPFATPASAQIPPGEEEEREVTVERFDGTDRYDTARLIAEDTFEEADTVVIAKAEDWPDALAGNFLAGVFEAPVLLISQNDVQAATLEALEALSAENVLLLGGPAAISEANEERLREEGYEVERIFGTTRYETAATIATRDFDEEDDFPLPLPPDFGQDDEGQLTAIVATGEQFADALVAGSVAFSENFPILLTPSGELHPAADAALDELEIEHVIIPGGTAAVEPAVQAQIEAKEIEVTRISGGPNTGRVETAIAFAEYAVDSFGYSTEHLNVATADPFADALAMGPHAGTELAPLLLTAGQGETLHPALDAYLRDDCVVTSLHIAGGVAAVSTTVEEALVEAAEDCTDAPDEDAALTFDVEDGEQVEQGQIITGEAREDIVSVTATGPCVDDDAEIVIGEDGSFEFQILDDAPEGDCDIEFTATDDEGETYEQTLTVEVVAADEDAALTFDVEDGEEVEQGQTISGEAREDIVSVTATGPCIDDDAEIVIGDDGSFEFQILEDAPEEECTIEFTATDEDGETHEQTLTVEVVAVAGPLTFDVEEGADVPQGATITATANEMMAVQWSGDCVENGNSPTTQEGDELEIVVEAEAELGTCEISFDGFGESGPISETLTINVVEATGEEDGNGGV